MDRASCYLSSFDGTSNCSLWKYLLRNNIFLAKKFFINYNSLNPKLWRDQMSFVLYYSVFNFRNRLARDWHHSRFWTGSIDRSQDDELELVTRAYTNLLTRLSTPIGRTESSPATDWRKEGLSTSLASAFPDRCRLRQNIELLVLGTAQNCPRPPHPKYNSGLWYRIYFVR